MLRLFALAGLAMTVLGARRARSAAQAQNATLYTVTYVEVGPVLAKVGAGRAARLSRRRAQGRASASTCSSASTGRTSSWCSAPGPTRRRSRRHAAGDTAKKLNEKLATMLAAPNDTRQHNALSVAPAKPARMPIVAVTHVDVIPPEKDNGANALEQLADGSRRHAGNLQFDVWRQTNRPNHFTVVEVLGQPRRVRRPPDAEGNPRVPHEARRRCRARSTTSGSTRCSNRRGASAADEARPLKMRRALAAACLARRRLSFFG